MKTIEYKFFYPWEENTSIKNMDYDELEKLYQTRVIPVLNKKSNKEYEVIFPDYTLLLENPSLILLLYFIGHDEYTAEYISRKIKVDEVLNKKRIAENKILRETDGLHGFNRFSNPKYKTWRDEVLKNCNHTCICGSKSTHAHHIKNKVDNMNLVYDVDNGIGLCGDCHREFHKTYGYRDTDEEQLKEFLYGRIRRES